jgi:transcription elongation factor Elf1
VADAELTQKQCPQCPKGHYSLYQLIMNDHNEAVAVECDTCGARFPVNVPRILSLNEAGLLADLIRGVQAKAKLRFYMQGADDADEPLIVVMRSFTHEDGGFLSEQEDVRDAYVWCSGFTEHWFKVSDLIKALDNMDGHHGLSAPMATIDYDKE